MVSGGLCFDIVGGFTVLSPPDGSIGASTFSWSRPGLGKSGRIPLKLEILP